VSTLNVIVLYDRWEEEGDETAAADKAPLTRTLDKKEVEDEVAETLGKLGHDATLHVLDGTTKSLHALARMDCDLVFNLAESFGGNDTADYCIAAYPMTWNSPSSSNRHARTDRSASSSTRSCPPSAS
jgi:hypothetical protein